MKLWDAETQKLVTPFEFGKDIEHQQLGCLWAGDYCLSVALSGNINYLDVNSGSVNRVIKVSIACLLVIKVSIGYHSSYYYC